MRIVRFYLSSVITFSAFLTAYSIRVALVASRRVAFSVTYVLNTYMSYCVGICHTP